MTIQLTHQNSIQICQTREIFYEYHGFFRRELFLIYTDDVIVFGRHLKEHNVRPSDVLEKLILHNLKTKLD